MKIATEGFRTLICCEPDRVWDELTATGRPLDWLYGMVIESTWQTGSRVTLGSGPRWGLVGEVLVADRPHRLSFTLGDTLSNPSVFVTWELAHETDATIVYLTVDEPQPSRDANRQIELAWLPCLLKLTTLLGDQATKANKEARDS
jgi:uncharacterized protein YndB with AHSA1/START domain